MEDQIREILKTTNDVFVFAAVHGYKYEGGDLTPKIAEWHRAGLRALGEDILGRIPERRQTVSSGYMREQVDAAVARAAGEGAV